MKQLILNGAALAQVVGDATRLRVRTADLGDYLELQIRPTPRASSVNLPKGETLVDIVDGKADLSDDALSGVTSTSQTLVVQKRKHGWFALVNAVATSAATAGADIG